MANFRFREGKECGLKIIDLQFACSFKFPWDETRCGTPALMAPEVVAKTVRQEFMAALDMWSVGVIFYILLNSGDYPFQNMKEVALLATGNYAATALLERVLKDPKLDRLSENAKDLLRQLLRLDPSHRPTAKQALEHP